MNLRPLLLLLPLGAFAQEDPWDDEAWEEDWGEEEAGLVWNGFAEAAYGTRFSEDPLIDNRSTLEDLRWRIETDWQFDDLTLSLKADAGYDGVEDDFGSTTEMGMNNASLSAVRSHFSSVNLPTPSSSARSVVDLPMATCGWAKATTRARVVSGI